MLILPELMAVFDSARLVHLIRHPIPSSIRRTHKTSRAGNPVGSAVLSAAYARCGLDSTRIKTDEDYQRNATTWLYQVEAVRRFASAYLSSDNYLELRYEDLCKNYNQVRQKLADFVGVENLVFDTNSSMPIVDERTNNTSFDQPQADEIWNLCGDVGVALGYSRHGVG